MGLKTRRPDTGPTSPLSPVQEITLLAKAYSLKAGTIINHKCLFCYLRAISPKGRRDGALAGLSKSYRACEAPGKLLHIFIPISLLSLTNTCIILVNAEKYKQENSNNQSGSYSNDRSPLMKEKENQAVLPQMVREHL